MVRQYVIAIAALAIAGAAAAEPSKAPLQNAAQPAGRAPVVIASASPVATSTPTAGTSAATPAKRVRTARVSTCRCGGQAPGEN